MDPLSSVLDGHRGRGASVLRCEMRSPWSLRVQDEAALGLVVMLNGVAHLVPEVGDREVLGAGDLALVRGPRPYVFADDPRTPPLAVIEPGNVCRSLTGEPLSLSLGIGTRTWGNAGGTGGDGPGHAAFLTASWELAGQLTGRLVDSLPDVAVVRGTDLDPTLAELLARELQRDVPGQDVVLDRLVDLVLVGAVREWFSRPGSGAPAWWSAGADPVVGPALARLHDEPGRAWTLDALAAEVHVSRATLSRKFTGLVGQPPMTYLKRWRLAHAADLLRAGGRSVEQVGREVGYGNAFAFSAAFSREHGMSPRAYRTARPGVGASSPVPPHGEPQGGR